MPQRMLLLTILLLPVMAVQAQVAEEDSLALVEIYNATSGQNWDDNSGWLTGPVASWQRVTVTGDRVTELNLHNNQLNGSLPAKLGDLTGLIVLDISTNQLLSGSIPPELGDLTSLIVLDLQNNRLSGSIPVELGNLTSLTALVLTDNQLSGSIPPELGNLTNLTFLLLNSNSLSGTLPLSLINLSMLNTFRFNNTALCEPIDDAFQAWLQGIADVSSTGCTTVSTEDATKIPADFVLEANYPNPFNPQTTIRYALPKAASVRLVVSDAVGRRVRVLVNDKQSPGWHEVVFEAGDLPSGVYFYRLEAGSFEASGQMLLVK